MNSKLLLLTIAAAAVLTACNKDAPVDAASGGPVTISVTIPEEGLTRVSMDMDSSDPDGPIKLAWEEGDVITVKNAKKESRQVTFNLISGAGTKNAVFAANDVTQIASAAKFNIYLDGTEPGNYNAQTQEYDGSISHLSYAASLQGVDSYENITFTQDWALANGGGNCVTMPILRLRAMLPSAEFADAVRKVTLNASEKIFDGSSRLTVSISNPGVEGDGRILTVYAALPAADVEIPFGTELFVRFQASEKAADTYTAYRKLDAMTLTCGKINAFKLDCSNIASYAGPDDNGTDAHPYLIADSRQMKAMGSLMASGATKYFRLVDDIDMSSTSWTPLNSSGSMGIYLDGNGKTVSKLGAPLMSDLNGTVTGLTVSGAKISGSADLGVIAKTVKTASGTLSGVKAVNCSVTASGGCAGGLIGTVGKSCKIFDCAAENVTVQGVTHYAGGIVAYMKSGTISRCHTSGSVTITDSGRHVGGIAGWVEAGEISNCHSSCDVHGHGFVGGIAGTLNSGGISMTRCYASGNVTTGEINGAGGLVGQVASPSVSITASVAWNGTITPVSTALDKYSSGAVVGRTHPNCVLTDNHRSRSMNLTAYWVPSIDYDHPDVNGTSAPLVRIGTDLDEANAAPTDLTGFDEDHGRWAYHGKHCNEGVKYAPDDSFGWLIKDGSTTSETIKIREGVEWTRIEGDWEGKKRVINIVKTKLSEKNRFGMYFDYGSGDQYTVPAKCRLVGALVGTNGPMACCQFVRIDGVVKHAATAVEDGYIANCALVYDNNDPDIVKVADNYAAAELPYRNVGCAGPLLVWNGEVVNTSGSNEFLTKTHPRTAIGITEDRKTIIQVTVDGRWSGRAEGMKISTLAPFMKSLGCYKAMNMDGGGGTIMWIDGYGVNGVVNHPCDSPMNWNNPTIRESGTALYIKK